jgi:hypothetical protein
VASLLAGKEAPPAPGIARSAPARPFTAPVPAEAVLKKLDLTAPIAVGSVAPGIRALDHAELLVRAPSGARCEPPLPPPRAQAVA